MNASEPISPQANHNFARQLLVWTPRILAILFALFISMFAMDVFQENNGFWPTVVALAMHLVPTAILVLVLIVCWRWPIAGVLFIGLGLWYIFGLHRMPPMTDLIVAGPPILCGVLFVLQAFIVRKRKD